MLIEIKSKLKIFHASGPDPSFVIIFGNPVLAGTVD